MIFTVYLIIVLVSAFLLYAPITHSYRFSGWNSVSFLDALFTSVSAFSDTGLVTKNTFETWNVFGEVIIAFLILIGGVGVFALKIYIFNILFFKKKTALKELELVSTERSSSNSREVKSIIVISISILFIVWIVFGFILTFYFYFNQPEIVKAQQLVPVEDTKNFFDYAPVGKFVSPYKNIGISFRYGFFHAISALNNAGFDIIGDNSLFAYYYNISLQVIFVILLVIGGLGYPVIHDIFNYFRYKFQGNKRKYQWQLVTKISVWTYFIVTLVGFLLLIAFEVSSKRSTSFWNDTKMFYGTHGKRVWSLLFISFSSRSAGFATFPMEALSSPSNFIVTVLMFLGAAPSSTGGGIRTTTFAIIILTLISRIMGRPSVRAFKRKIADSSVRNSFLVFLTGIILVLTGTFIISTSSTNYGGAADATKFHFQHYLFEVASAFGTAGLTTGVTAYLNVVSKITMIFIMFIGQFGISSSILVWGRKRNYTYRYEYLTQEVITG
ncbi:TrkH family potassium uptake protein [Mycoplasmopsis columbinasalis]|uniref:Ktr system potassium uptake protein B n=1 Tax=Mycoplasmopsis columbinasalis TaxID=114880 RepID=A0A449BAV8_9BACT|nr:potassium transporter TrkG [Mycoplasmopsis columbinasalis]VEU78346.1 Ktr system potassium uptake protein B [Mycoplasmopsis columbinasalis]